MHHTNCHLAAVCHSVHTGIETVNTDGIVHRAIYFAVLDMYFPCKICQKNSIRGGSGHSLISRIYHIPVQMQIVTALSHNPHTGSVKNVYILYFRILTAFQKNHIIFPQFVIADHQPFALRKPYSFGIISVSETYSFCKPFRITVYDCRR